MAIIHEQESTDLVREYYIDYAKYVLSSRSIPSMVDGFKPVQRRLVWCASKLPTSISKSAKIIGDTMPYHPHEDGSAYGALVGLTTKTNRFHLFESHGNFGSPGFEASAMRYTGASLSEMARFCYTQFADYADFQLGETDLPEPVALPALIPYAMVQGSEGIAVGLSTNVMPLNLMELIDYFIDTLKGKMKKSIPTPDVGNFILDMDDREIDQAVIHNDGKLTVRSIVTKENSRIAVVDDLYQGSGRGRKSIEEVCHELGDLIDTGKVDFRDESGTSVRYVFEVMDANAVDIDSLVERLTELTVRSKSFRRVLADGESGVYVDLDHQVNHTLDYLRAVVKRKFEHDLEKLQYQEKVLLAIELIKSSGLLKKIAEMDKKNLISKLVELGVEEAVADDAVRRPISYLTNSHKAELEEIQKKIEDNRGTDITEYLIGLYRQLKKLAKPQFSSYPHSVRRSKLLKHPTVKFDGKHTLRISDDKGGVPCKELFLIWKDGTVEPLLMDSVTRKDISLDDSPADVISRLTGRYFIVFTSRGRALAVDLDRINDKYRFINLEGKEKVSRVLQFDESDDSVEYKGKVKHGMKYLVSRRSNPREW